MLRDYGLSASDIAAVSGISVTLVRRLLRLPPDQQPSIHRSSAEAILGVPLAGLSKLRRNRGLTLSDTSAACLQELAEQGWPTGFLASRLGTSTRTIAAIRARKRPRISIELDRAIQNCHETLTSSSPDEYGIAVHRSRKANAAARQRAAQCLQRSRVIAY